jgi:hypothetical protein
MSSSTGNARSARMDDHDEDRGVEYPGGARSLLLWRMLSAALLLVMGGIHLFFVLTGTGGELGVLFVLNAIGALVLAIAMVVAPRGLLPLASVLSLLFMVGTLLALVFALTVGLFGISATIGGELVVTTIVVESIGIIVLAATTAMAYRMRHAR